MSRNGEPRKLDSNAALFAKPPTLLEEEVYLNMMVSQALLARKVTAFFRKRRLTPVTYNILRILRGAGPEGLPCSKISERMLTQVPDVTRLVDRLVRLGWVQRYRTEQDRRMVFQTLTPEGSHLLAQMDAPLRELHVSQFAHMTPGELERLNDLLIRSRKLVEE